MISKVLIRTAALVGAIATVTLPGTTSNAASTLGSTLPSTMLLPKSALPADAIVTDHHVDSTMKAMGHDGFPWAVANYTKNHAQGMLFQSINDPNTLHTSAHYTVVFVTRFSSHSNAQHASDGDLAGLDSRRLCASTVSSDSTGLSEATCLITSKSRPLTSDSVIAVTGRYEIVVISSINSHQSVVASTVVSRTKTVVNAEIARVLRYGVA